MRFCSLALLQFSFFSGRASQTRVRLMMSSSSAYPTGINPDGTLRDYPMPVPQTPACIAASTGDADFLRSIGEADLLAPEESSGNTPLIWAADRGHTRALEVILESVERQDQSSVNARGYIGNTALSRAARGGHLDCVKALLAATLIDPNIPNEKMQYPLHFAAYKRHAGVVQALLSASACSTMVTDRKGRTPAEDTKDEAIRSMILAARSAGGKAV